LVVQGDADGAAAFQYTCLDLVDQHWHRANFDANRNQFMLVNRNSKKCLVVESLANGARATQYECDPYARSHSWRWID
jgi:hypothetical protein